MEEQRSYIPIRCWKCSAPNNLAQSKICRGCGCYLKTAVEMNRTDTYGTGLSDFAPFRGYVWSAIVLVLVICGVMYYQKMSVLDTAAVAGKVKKVEVELPPDSWYAKSWWSYVSKTPSVKQILQKNVEVGGKMMSPEIARTISISGKVSMAIGDCYAQTCADERQKARDLEERNENFRFEQQTGAQMPSPTGSRELITPKVSDAWRSYFYREFGIVEVAAKLPERSMRKARANTPNGPFQTVEIVEVFNGQSGSKTTRHFDQNGKVAKSDVETMDPGKVALMRLELESLWQRNFTQNTDQKVRGLENLNEKPVFVITSKNREGYPETQYFDAVTGFLVKMDTKDFAVYFDDYRAYEQAKIPGTLYYRRAEPAGYHSWLKMEVTDWKIGDYIDDSIFEGQ